MLANAGVEVLPVDADHVELRSTAGRAVFRVQRLERPLKPSTIGPAPTNSSLLAIPRATPAAMAEARRLRWSVVTDDGSVAVRFPRNRWIRIDAALVQPATSRNRGPARWGLLTVVRRLLEQAPTTQTELASRSQLSQARVSQLLKPLAAQGLVEKTTHGWIASDWDGLCDWWLAQYRGPGGIATYWYALDDVPAQAAKAAHLHGAVGRAAISGDVAADFIAPWRRPVRAVVYAERAIDLSREGWTPADATAATLELVNPKDPGVWPDEPVAGGEAYAAMPLADPLQVLWDVLNSRGSDAPEAAARLRTVVRQRQGKPDKIVGLVG